ncbi:MAG: hypothetical protein QNJ53_20330 [Pleurocapsa sp. MO_192.B19]|nr:hypothetical protein [Pleurocapsa sp. MO_192.B19]
MVRRISRSRQQDRALRITRLQERDRRIRKLQRFFLSSGRTSSRRDLGRTLPGSTA